MVKICGKCGQELPLTSFHKAKKEKDGLQCWCISCRKSWKREERLEYHRERYYSKKDAHLDWSYKRRYGIDLAQYETLLEEQNGLCAICSTNCSSGRRLCVDHNHKTGKVRGLLCGNCNKGLGSYMDSVKLLKQAIKYLNENNESDQII